MIAIIFHNTLPVPVVNSVDEELRASAVRRTSVSHRKRPGLVGQLWATCLAEFIFDSTISGASHFTDPWDSELRALVVVKGDCI